MRNSHWLQVWLPPVEIIPMTFRDRPLIKRKRKGNLADIRTFLPAAAEKPFSPLALQFVDLLIALRVHISPGKNPFQIESSIIKQLKLTVLSLSFNLNTPFKTKSSILKTNTELKLICHICMKCCRECGQTNKNGGKSVGAQKK